MADKKALTSQSQLQAMLQALQLQQEGEEKKEFKFWNTQPVPKFEDEGPDGVLEADRDIKDVPAEPLTLPAGFEWDSLDIADPVVLDELYTLLYKNYVEDDDNMFRFDYSRDFLKWALQPPGWKRVWHCGVRSSSSKKLLAFISAIPANIRMRERTQLLVEINFLCVHKNLRAKRLAPVLIREITRRVNREGIFQAAYTAGKVIPRPVSQARYFHRSLNPKKLIDVQFSHLPKHLTLANVIKRARLPTEPLTPGLRPMKASDVPQVTQLLKDYLARFALAPVFSEEEVAHWLIPREGVVFSYVVEDAASKKVTDLVSFYSLPSTIVKSVKYDKLMAAYSYYNVPGKTPIKQLVKDALILAKQMDYDVFNALSLMENETFLDELQFGRGDGELSYYLYNYRMQPFLPSELGLVLL